MKTTANDGDWKIMSRFLPAHWASKAAELGALTRKRKIGSAETLLRVLLIHLADGKSLRTTAAYASEVGLCKIEDVALLHRLRVSGEWLRWMALELLAALREKRPDAELSPKFRVRIVDGTSISPVGWALPTIIISSFILRQYPLPFDNSAFNMTRIHSILSAVLVGSAHPT